MLQAESIVKREEYLLLDIGSEQKHEFFQGQVFAMAGGTFRHARVAGNLFASLSQQLRDKLCQPLNSDMRIHTPSGLDTYPDISVYCGQPELNDNQTTLLNPTVIIEVLSPSTRDYDRGGKFTHYRSLASLQDYLLVDPDIVLVEHFHRLGRDEWLFHIYSDLAACLSLESLGISLQLEAIYMGL